MNFYYAMGFVILAFCIGAIVGDCDGERRARCECAGNVYYKGRCFTGEEVKP